MSSIPKHDTVVLVPIRSFSDAKSRLAGALSVDQRRSLVRSMAATVVRAAHDLPVRIVTDDHAVISWALTVGAEPLSPGVHGLNQSIAAAFAEVSAKLVSPNARVIVAHADLPLARDLRIVDGPGVAIAPDRHRDGSNVLSIPATLDFGFAYGPGSFAAHRREAARCGRSLTVIDDPSLALDIDHPDDLTAMTAQSAATD